MIAMIARRGGLKLVAVAGNTDSEAAAAARRRPEDSKHGQRTALALSRHAERASQPHWISSSLVLFVQQLVLHTPQIPSRLFLSLQLAPPPPPAPGTHL